MPEIPGYRIVRQFRETHPVYLAERNEELVVLKRCEPDFTDEHGLLTKLDHPHIVRCFGKLSIPGPIFQQDAEYVVLEYAGSADLKLLRQQQAFTPETIALYAGQLVDALIYLHGQALVHNDIKPHNVVPSGAIAKLIDFNIARQTGKLGSEYGTMGYRCLDQLSYKVLPSNDVFGLGATLFFLHEGESPYLLHTQGDKDRYRDQEGHLLGLGPAKALPRSQQNDVIMGMIEPLAENRPTLEEVAKAFPFTAAPRSLAPSPQRLSLARKAYALLQRRFA